MYAFVLVEYKLSSSNSKYVMSAINHLARFFNQVVISAKSAATLARVLVERVFSVFSDPETLHSDQGSEFENETIKELQPVLGFRKTCLSACRPRGNLVIERVYITLHTLAMYVNVKYENWAELLIHLVHNTAYNKTLEKTPHI